MLNSFKGSVLFELSQSGTRLVRSRENARSDRSVQFCQGYKKFLWNVEVWNKRVKLLMDIGNVYFIPL